MAVAEAVDASYPQRLVNKAALKGVTGVPRPLSAQKVALPDNNKKGRVKLTLPFFIVHGYLVQIGY